MNEYYSPSDWSYIITSSSLVIMGNFSKTGSDTAREKKKTNGLITRGREKAVGSICGMQRNFSGVSMVLVLILLRLKSCRCPMQLYRGYRRRQGMSECDSVKKSDQLQVDTSGAGAGPHVIPFQLLDLCGGETHERSRAVRQMGPTRARPYDNVYDVSTSHWMVDANRICPPLILPIMHTLIHRAHFSDWPTSIFMWLGHAAS